MSYRTKIKELEAKYKLLEQKISNAKNSSNLDDLENLLSQRGVCLSELSRLRKLQWEEDHERVNLDDSY